MKSKPIFPCWYGMGTHAYAYALVTFCQVNLIMIFQLQISICNCLSLSPSLKMMHATRNDFSFIAPLISINRSRFGKKAGSSSSCSCCWNLFFLWFFGNSLWWFLQLQLHILSRFFSLRGLYIQVGGKARICLLPEFCWAAIDLQRRWSTHVYVVDDSENVFVVWRKCIIFFWSTAAALCFPTKLVY